MKKIFFITLSLMIMSLSAVSLSARGMGKGLGNGECGGPGMGMGMHKPFMHLEMLQNKLDLTDSQIDKIYQINKEYMDKFHQNRKDADKVRELLKQQDIEIEKVLTKEQKQKWEEMKKNRPMRDKKRGEGKGNRIMWDYDDNNKK